MSNLSTAIAISEVCKQSVYDPETLIIAARIAELGNFSDEIITLLMDYSAHLSADTATRVIAITMSKDSIHNMMSELKEMGEFDNL